MSRSEKSAGLVVVLGMCQAQQPNFKSKSSTPAPSLGFSKIGLILVLSLAVAAIGSIVWLIGLPEQPYQLVSKEYNFSAVFPDTPTSETDVNDEGLPETKWTLKHDHGTWTEYFQVQATCYNEVLDPAKEFGGADADPALILNGVKVLKSERIAVHALKTGRELPAFNRLSQDTATGNIQSHAVIIDGHCMIDAGARMDRNAGPAVLFMESVKILN